MQIQVEGRTVQGLGNREQTVGPGLEHCLGCKVEGILDFVARGIVGDPRTDLEKNSNDMLLHSATGKLYNYKIVMLT